MDEELSIRLTQVAEELRGIAMRLDAPAAEPVNGEPRGSTEGEIELSAAECAEIARGIYADRRVRARYFKSSLLGEPAWDMLLDLFVSHHAGKVLSTTSLCLASDVPTTTALRYIAALVDLGLATKRSDPHDLRVTNVAISEEGVRLMRQYLSETTGARHRQGDRRGPSLLFNLGAP
jgi:DNA-binding MarR family transcriptional regulator